jgi:hypothetical protein
MILEMVEQLIEKLSTGIDENPIFPDLDIKFLPG